SPSRSRIAARGSRPPISPASSSRSSPPAPTAPASASPSSKSSSAPTTARSPCALPPARGRPSPCSCPAPPAVTFRDHRLVSLPRAPHHFRHLASARSLLYRPGMWALARKILLHDRVKFGVAAAGVSISVLLV